MAQNLVEHLDGATLSLWARRATTGLKNEQATINKLNVFPIPDSDTGTNMARTMEAAVTALDEIMGPEASLTEVSVVDVATALSLGALRGARGNSGLVLSQLLRAVSVAAVRGPIDGAALAEFLRLGAEYARDAISRPVEGTVITVLDAAAAAAKTVAAGTVTDSAACAAGETISSAGIEKTVDAALAAAEEALVNTQTQLQVLQQAGVVDAGGYGLVLMLRCLQEVCRGAEQLEDNASVAMVVTQEVEVMFSFEVAVAADAVETEHVQEVIARLRDIMERLGNCVVVSPVTETEATMHVHTAAAGPIIEHAFRLGKVSNLRIEVLPEHHEEEEVVVASLPIIAMCPNTGQDQKTVNGVQQIFESLGAATACSGDHEVHGVKSTNGSVLVLVNGQDVTGLRESAAGASLEFIDTGSIVGGLAALAVFDESAEWEDTVDDMLTAVASQRWENLDAALTQNASRLSDYLIMLVDDGRELLTLLWDGDAQLRQVVESAVERLKFHNKQVEVQAIHAPGLGVPVQIGVE